MEDNLKLSWEEFVVQRIERSCKTSFGLIDDPDSILSEQMLSLLIDRGWQVTSVTDQLELRFEYEDQIRQGPTILPERIIFIVRFPFADVPFDIREEADTIQLFLKIFFPDLSSRVIRSLPMSWHSLIFNKQFEIKAKWQSLDDIETANFVIRDCLGLDYGPNPSFVDILSLLADVALHKLEIPPSLRSVLQSQLSNSALVDLYDYMETPGKASQFLRKVWDEYIQYKLNKNLGTADKLVDDVTKSVIQLDENREFQTKVTALVAEKILQPAHVSEDKMLPNWMHSGIHYFHDQTNALQEALTHLSNKLPGENAGFKEWTEFAFQWGEWILDYHQVKRVPPDLYRHLGELKNRLDRNYFAWLDQHYPSLIMQPYLPAPSCVHHILNHIASTFKPSSSHPIALVIVDGMAIHDWLVIQSELLEANLTWQISVKGVLALVPTLTSVSRQALLSGKLPRYFEKSWLNTNSEEMYWRSFWEEQGFHSKTIAYIRGLGRQYTIGETERVLETSVEEVLQRPQLSIAAFIVNTIDELIHTGVLGERELDTRVRHWAKENRYPRVLISKLLDRFDTVIVTSDHGHIAGTGIGDLSLSSVAEERALRVRIFKGHVFEKLVGEISEIALWQNTGLPNDATVVLPKSRGFFAKEGYSGISHGGASLEETIVPYITISR